MKTLNAQITKLSTLLTAVFLLASCLVADSQVQTNLYVVDTTTPHTNLISSTTVASVAGVMTNAPMFQVKSNNITLGDSWPASFGKMGSNDVWLARRISAVETNPPTIRFTNTLTGAPGTAVIITDWAGMAGVFQVTIPAGSNGVAGAPGTNTVTAMNFTNAVLNSVEIVTYQTNYSHWAASNKLARVAGLTRWRVDGGSDGGNPPQNIPIYLVASLSGSNGWFTLTNGYWTASNITVSAICALTNPISGLAQATLGYAALYSLDHLELKDRVNSMDGQTWLVRGSPIASQADVATAVANALDGHLVGAYANNVYHLTYSKGNDTILDIASTNVVLPIAMAVDGTGTNLAITTPVTNLVSGWTVVSSTNLLLVNGFTTYTNYSTNITSGILTITTPIQFGETMRFYQIVGPGADAVNWGVKQTMPGLITTVSNALPLTAVTLTGSPFNWTNRMGMNLTVFVYGSVGQQTKLNGTTLVNSYTSLLTLPMQPGDWITVTYSGGTPLVWWKPF